MKMSRFARPLSDRRSLREPITTPRQGHRRNNRLSPVRHPIAHRPGAFRPQGKSSACHQYNHAYTRGIVSLKFLITGLLRQRFRQNTSRKSPMVIKETDLRRLWRTLIALWFASQDCPTETDRLYLSGRGI